MHEFSVYQEKKTLSFPLPFADEEKYLNDIPKVAWNGRDQNPFFPSKFINTLSTTPSYLMLSDEWMNLNFS